MTPTDVTDLLDELLRELGWDPHPEREPIRVWAHSGVERLRWPDGTSVVVKYADAPFDREPHALRVAADADLPVPHLHGVRTANGLAVMLMEDLGEPLRDADDSDGARVAVPLHAVGRPRGLDTLDGAGLANLPERIATRLTLRGLDGYSLEAARELAKAASVRAVGADLPPFGLVHSEFHRTSVHVGAEGLHLLDFARAFTGPGLLDLASWHGTVEAPSIDRTHDLIDAYVHAGGPPEALHPRGGLGCAAWALGWHRVWVVDWYAHQIELGWSADAPRTWTNAIARHLREAVELLNP